MRERKKKSLTKTFPTTNTRPQCPNLRSLELPYKSHISSVLLSSLVGTVSASKGTLTSLSLAYCADVRSGYGLLYTKAQQSACMAT